MAYGREINTELTSALVNIPAVNTLNWTYNICDIVSGDKTALFKVAFYSDQSKLMLMFNFILWYVLSCDF